MKARIIKIISNQYTVLTEDNERIVCVAMGKVRLQTTPVVGDLVEVERYDDQVGIEKVLERKNTLVRPAIANVDQAIIVMSSKDPDFSTTLVDRISFLIQIANIQPILCITKMDLVDPEDELYQVIDDYRKSGYTCLLCGKDSVDDELAAILCDKITVLTGQSGVGKSTLLNTLDASFELRTQETSKALGRGKHTTRHTELHEVAGGWVADTPGFSSLDFTQTTPIECANALFEFKPYIGKCKFRDCIHVNEPGCAIKEAVAHHDVSKIRYENYLQCLPLMKK